MDRREILKALTAAGVATPVLARAIAAAAEESAVVTADMIRQAEWLTGLDLTDDERELMREDVAGALAEWRKLRQVPLENSVPPAVAFDPLPARTPPTGGSVKWESPSAAKPGSREDVAFAPVSALAAWLRRKEISSAELTALYLARLKKHDPRLACVITLTEERALRQAADADRRIAAGDARGPLDGIPWGAKDLLAVAGYRTTWGAKPYENQTFGDSWGATATVVGKLDRAGAVLLAKLSVGALAWGDVWFGGTTKNPWNPEQGSSGSSAGPAAATAAGLVGFAIGTETWGSIVSPSTRCGVSGLRPTFGRVSRHGCMALSWSMDKIGPMARSLDDCAWIFDAVRGADGLDPSARDAAFSWPAADIRKLRVGYVPALFEEEPQPDADEEEAAQNGVQDAEAKAAARAKALALAAEWKEIDRRALKELEGMGVELIPVELPDDPPVAGLSLILTAEATAAFDELTRTGQDDLLVRQERYAWPNVFRQGQLIPAVEYVRANRIRTLLMRKMEELFARVDVYVTPTFGGNNLLLTNLTGHPQVVMPNGFRSDGTPTSITFTGKLFGETELLALGAAYQRATDHHLKRPPL
jgi:Asp-tRNA(Asn)/Glu-tRNA(Gln) amidotransferase A subunit family amidase